MTVHSTHENEIYFIEDTEEPPQIQINQAYSPPLNSILITSPSSSPFAQTLNDHSRHKRNKQNEFLNESPSLTLIHELNSLEEQLNSIQLTSEPRKPKQQESNHNSNFHNNSHQKTINQKVPESNLLQDPQNPITMGKPLSITNLLGFLFFQENIFNCYYQTQRDRKRLIKRSTDSSIILLYSDHSNQITQIQDSFLQIVKVCRLSTESSILVLCSESMVFFYDFLSRKLITTEDFRHACIEKCYAISPNNKNTTNLSTSSIIISTMNIYQYSEQEFVQPFIQYSALDRISISKKQQKYIDPRNKNMIICIERITPKRESNRLKVEGYKEIIDVIPVPHIDIIICIVKPSRVILFRKNMQKKLKEFNVFNSIQQTGRQPELILQQQTIMTCTFLPEVCFQGNVRRNVLAVNSTEQTYMLIDLISGISFFKQEQAIFLPENKYMKSEYRNNRLNSSASSQVNHNQNDTQTQKYEKESTQIIIINCSKQKYIPLYQDAATGNRAVCNYFQGKFPNRVIPHFGSFEYLDGQSNNKTDVIITSKNNTLNFVNRKSGVLIKYIPIHMKFKESSLLHQNINQFTANQLKQFMKQQQPKSNLSNSNVATQSVNSKRIMENEQEEVEKQINKNDGKKQELEDDNNMIEEQKSILLKHLQKLQVENDHLQDQNVFMSNVRPIAAIPEHDFIVLIFENGDIQYVR